MNPLTDTFGRKHTYLRIALTERCNLRCRYCMPAEGIELRPKAEMLTFEEIVRLSSLFAAQGVTKIRLTGGEPLIRKDLESLVRGLRTIPGIEHLAVTTNGLLLPQKLGVLQEAGVDLFNISLDTLRPERFEQITRRPGLERVMESIRVAVDAGYDPVKINCVVLRGLNDDELVDFAAMTRDQPIDVRFIEYMPFGGNDWDDDRFISGADIRTIIQDRYPDLERLSDEENLTARLWRVPGFVGRIGFISSMSNQFCASCNRLRLTADGNLKVCLFGNSEVSLRDALRSGAGDDDLLQLIGAAVGRKKEAHGGMYAIARSENRPMILIGG